MGGGTPDGDEDGSSLDVPALEAELARLRGVLVQRRRIDADLAANVKHLSALPPRRGDFWHSFGRGLRGGLIGGALLWGAVAVLVAVMRP